MSRIIAKQLIKKIIVTVSVKAVYLAQNIFIIYHLKKFQIKFITFMKFNLHFSYFPCYNNLKDKNKLRIG